MKHWESKFKCYGANLACYGVRSKMLVVQLLFRVVSVSVPC